MDEEGREDASTARRASVSVANAGADTPVAPSAEAAAPRASAPPPSNQGYPYNPFLDACDRYSQQRQSYTDRLESRRDRMQSLKAWLVANHAKPERESRRLEEELRRLTRMGFESRGREEVLGRLVELRRAQQIQKRLGSRILKRAAKRLQQHMPAISAGAVNRYGPLQALKTELTALHPLPAIGLWVFGHHHNASANMSIWDHFEQEGPPG